MGVILSAVRFQIALVYLDDIVVFSKSLGEHIAHVFDVLTLLRNAGATLKHKRYCFFAEKMNYLRHVTRPRRLELRNKQRTLSASYSNSRP